MTQALNRFGLGAGPDDARTGDAQAMLKAQLPGPDPALASPAFAGLPTGLAAMDALRDDIMARRTARQQKLPAGSFVPKTRGLFQAEVAAQFGWAATTQASFRERLVWFWSNHFTASTAQRETAGLIGPMIREAIRPHVTGNFTDMVLAVERHPAMLRYLNNANSIGPDSPAGLRTGRGLNENLGRECMELHTVGLAAGYSQQDVTGMAKILTGWSTAGSGAGGGDATGYRFRPALHEPGPQTVLGHSFDGGEQAGIEALTFLSRYPTTHKLLAAKLVTQFVADDPSPDAVDRIAAVLRETEGDLGAAAAALVDLPQAWTPLAKLKTPQEFAISTVRAAPPEDGSPINYIGVLTGLGQPPWGAPLPNGWADQAAAWGGSDALLARIDWGYTYAGRFGDGGVSPPGEVAQAALGPLLRPATATAIANAGSRREALTMLFAAPEFARR